MKKISKKGYSIVKSSISKKELNDLKRLLTVIPHVNQEYGDVPHSFEIFRENKEKIFIPRFFGIKKYGIPEIIKFQDYPQMENLEFAFSLRDNQKPAVDACLKSLNDTGGGILCVKCGGGKCLGKDTSILMYDGTIKMVQDIVVGDSLMGDDSTSRNVLSICRGKEKMYKVIQSKGDDYRVNESHILSLINKETGQIEDISVTDYLANKEKHKILNGYKVNIDFEGLKKNKYINYAIRLEEEQVDDYYGFEIDGNRRFVLGDFTVTHNTVMSLYLASVLKLKTLVIVHKTFLLNQWKERIEEFLPNASVGIIRQKKIDIEDKDIVIGMLQSISMKDYNKNLFADNFGFVIYDEVHHASSEVFSRALPLVSTKYMLGLTATPNRKDGLTKVFKWYLGEIAFASGMGDNIGVVIKRINFSSNSDFYCREHTNFKGQLMLPKMITQVTAYNNRNKIILNEIKQYATDDGRQILVLSDRRSHLNYLKNETDKMCIKRNEEQITTGFYVGGGGSSKKKELELKESETKDVVFGTFAMAKEGLDIPTLNTLILASPIGDVEQAVGRILRKKQDVYPIVIDIVDRFSIFNSQGIKRRNFYSKNKYYIKDIFIDDKEEYTEKMKKLDKAELYDAIEKFSQLDISIVKKEKEKKKVTTIEEYMFLSDNSDDDIEKIKN